MYSYAHFHCIQCMCKKGSYRSWKTWKVMEFKNFIFYNGSQKCWDLSSDISKTSDPSPPTPNKVGSGAKWVKMSAFFGHNTLLGEVGGGGGGRRDEPKAEQKIVLRSRVLRNYCLEGLFHTVPSSFVLDCRPGKSWNSIVDP